MSQHATLPDRALVALCFSYVVSAFVNLIVYTTALFETPERGDVASNWPSLVSISAVVVLAAFARRAPAWRPLAVGHALMLTGIAVATLNSWSALAVGSSLTVVGNRLVAAVLLVAAWRADRTRTIALAAVFALPNLGVALFFDEYLNSSLTKSGWLTVASVLTLASATLILVVRHSPGGLPTAHERPIPTLGLVGCTLLIGGIALQTINDNPFVWGQRTVVALALITVGAASLRIARRGLAVSGPIHLDQAVLLLSLLGSAWLTFWSTGVSGPTLGLVPSFDDVESWHRGVVVTLLVGLVPGLWVILRRSPRWLAIAPVAVAVGGAFTLSLVAADEALGRFDYSAQLVLLQGGAALLLGGTVALALTRIDGTSIEFGLIYFLAAFPLVFGISSQALLDLVPITAGTADASELRPFNLVGIGGLLGLAVWWFVREPDRHR